MKWTIVLVMAMLAAGLLAEATPEPQSPNTITLAGLAMQERMPVGKLVHYLGLATDTHANASLAELKLTQGDIDAAVNAYYTSESLAEIATHCGVPVKKLNEFLPGDDIDIYAPLGTQGFGKADVMQARQRFIEQRTGYVTGIVIVGMLVVFASLIIIGLVINQLRHVDPQNRKKKAQKAAPEATAKAQPEPEPDVSTNAIIAVITALHLHVQEVEEQHKLMLTWKRTPMSMWRAGKVTMPNREYALTRRK